MPDPVKLHLRLTAVLAAALLSMSTPATSAGNKLEIIPLQHRTVADVLPVVEPLVSEGGTVTGMNNQLIVRSDAANIAEIRQVLAAIDTALKQLRITVRQDVSGFDQRREDALSARIRSGDLDARLDDPGYRRDGARVTIRDGDSAVSYRSFNTRRDEDNNASHFVTAVEGRPAFIYTGESRPYVRQSTAVTPFGAYVQQGVEFRDVASGFYVTPRVSGDRVTLDIAPQLESASDSRRGAIDIRRSETSVSGRLGEWIPLGGVDQSRTFQGSANANTASTRSTGESNYDVWVKVDLVQ